MSAQVVKLAESLLVRVNGPQKSGLEIEYLAESEFFPKYGEDCATQDDHDAAWAEFQERFEAAVDDMAAEWGDPIFYGDAEDCPQWWGSVLGVEVAYWHRGDSVVCVHLGQEDKELPVHVGVAVFRTDFSWGRRDGNQNK